jgi:8-oxo-dGTP pyrophosphatase MutT (NUDIX family)
MSLASYFCSTPLGEMYYKTKAIAIKYFLRDNRTMKETQSAGGIVLNPRGEVALVRNGPGKPWWGFPKGHLDEGESKLEAARREVTEETGIDQLELIGDLSSYVRYKGKPGGGDDMSERKEIHMFLFTTTQEHIAPIDPGNPEARWVPQDEVARMLTHEKDREFYDSVKYKLPTIG